MIKVLKFFKTNFIFTVAVIAAIISCFFVPVDKEYLGYFDVDTFNYSYSGVFKYCLFRKNS